MHVKNLAMFIDGHASRRVVAQQHALGYLPHIGLFVCWLFGRFEMFFTPEGKMRQRQRTELAAGEVLPAV